MKFRAGEPQFGRGGGVVCCCSMQPAKATGRRGGVRGAATAEAECIRHSM